MLEKWTGRLIGRMHNERVSYDELATELGVTKAYVSMVLNGARKPAGIKARMEGAFEAVLEKRKMSDVSEQQSETDNS